MDLQSCDLNSLIETYSVYLSHKLFCVLVEMSIFPMKADKTHQIKRLCLLSYYILKTILVLSEKHKEKGFRPCRNHWRGISSSR